MSPARSHSRLVAMVLALAVGAMLAGGTAYAAPLTAKKVKQIAGKVVDKKAPTLSVAKAESAKTADTAKTATTATTAATAQKVSGYEVVQRIDTLLGASTNLNGAVLNCPAGKKAVGGGVVMSSFQAAINQSGPSGDGQGWDVDIVRLNGSTDVTVTIRVICLPVV